MKLLGEFYKVVSDSPSPSGHEYVIALNPEHFIYGAHFPGEPVTPGVCIMQIAVELLSQACGRRMYLHCVRNVKFLNVITPEEGRLIRYSLSGIGGQESEFKVQVTVSSDDMIFAKLSMVCQPVPVQ